MDQDRIEKRIELKAPVSRVWLALTDVKQFGEWFRVRLEQPFVARQESTGFITWPGYEHLRWTALVVDIEPETLFSFRWHPYAVDPKVDYSGEEMTLVEFRLQPIADGTLLTVLETGFSGLPAHRRAEAFLKNDGGWAQQMDNVKSYVEPA